MIHAIFILCNKPPQNQKALYHITKSLHISMIKANFSKFTEDSINKSIRKNQELRDEMVVGRGRQHTGGDSRIKGNLACEKERSPD